MIRSLLDTNTKKGIEDVGKVLQKGGGDCKGSLAQTEIKLPARPPYILVASRLVSVHSDSMKTRNALHQLR